MTPIGEKADGPSLSRQAIGESQSPSSVRLHRANASLLRQSRKLNTDCTSSRDRRVKVVEGGGMRGEGMAEAGCLSPIAADALKSRAEAERNAPRESPVELQATRAEATTPALGRASLRGVASQGYTCFHGWLDKLSTLTMTPNVPLPPPRCPLHFAGAPAKTASHRVVFPCTVPSLCGVRLPCCLASALLCGCGLLSSSLVSLPQKQRERRRRRQQRGQDKEDGPEAHWKQAPSAATRPFCLLHDGDRPQNRPQDRGGNPPTRQRTEEATGRGETQTSGCVSGSPTQRCRRQACPSIPHGVRRRTAQAQFGGSTKCGMTARVPA
jgi:hypothetical protein